MATITLGQVQAAADRARKRTLKSDRTILAEMRDTPETRFQIFLSHSSRDRELVIGTKQLIEEAGYTVYVDWIEDAELDRSLVDRKRAEHVRTRMHQCETLFYAHTPNAKLSKWCPWELGYFDALKIPDRQVFVLPILGNEGETYKGQEYLSLYETVDLKTYQHLPRAKRDMAQFEQDRLRDLLGFRRPSPARRNS